MLRFIEYSLLAVSLIVILGLIVGGSRGWSRKSAERDSSLPKERSDAQERGKTL